MSNWSKTIDGNVLLSGSAPQSIPSGYIALYVSSSNGSFYYQASGSSATLIG